MSLHLYDTWTRSVREFTSLKPNEVGLYTCGPTVYDYQHIGNYRTFLFEDGLKRVLKLNGYRVNHVMNITDVGHLVSDADEGEDKMEKGSRRTGKTAWDIAALYTESFVADLKSLGIEFPTTLCKATDNIPEQIAFVQEIEKKGYTYRTSDGIYFDTAKQPTYGYLGRLDIAGLQAGARVDLGEKKNATDYALWKFSKPEDQRQMEWDSPWGRGFPGWHIECSAMAHKYLGAYFDIHCGGEDHITVHHPNEISQTEAAYGTRLANFWMHGYFILLNSAKMSKSSGEFLRVQLLLDKGYDPIAYRYLCLTAHYRSQLTFSWDALDAAQTALERLRHSAHSLGAPGVADQGFVARWMEKLNDDLNFPQALALTYELLKSELAADVKKATLLKFDEAFGLGLANWVPKVEDVPATVRSVADARWAARNNKDWAEADRLRGELTALGWAMKDGKDGYTLTKA
ncbi:MAG: cysteine--tRNA ligase [Burkholderiales bacterium]|nr:cysteine--tRNA ligase [Burkholderiales bacterium]